MNHIFKFTTRVSQKWRIVQCHLLAKLSNGAAALYEVLEEVFLSLQVPRGHQPQIDHKIIWHALLIKGAEQLT